MWPFNLINKDSFKEAGKNPNTVQLLELLAGEIAKAAKEKLKTDLEKIGSPPAPGSLDQAAWLNYLQNLFNLFLETFETKAVQDIFRSKLAHLKKRFGSSSHYSDFVKSLPTELVGADRLLLLSRPELEKELSQAVNQLSEMKLNLTNSVGDRTKQVSAERNKLSVILSGISDCVIALDLNRNIVTFNRAAEKLLGVPANQAIGKPISQVINIFDGPVHLSETSWAPNFKENFEGIIFARSQLRVVVVSSGRELFVNLTSGQILEGLHINLGGILTMHDVTEEKQLETMKLDFISMAAHELRTPLTTIKGYLSVLIKDYQSKFNPDQMMLINRVTIATSQLATLVENLLNVSRIERGVLNVTLEPVDWLMMVRQTIEEFVTRATEKQILLKLQEPAHPLPPISADKSRITEVLANLLSNAINYTKPGGSITVWLEQSGPEIITHVSDSGQGIPKESLPLLFTKFFRVTGNLNLAGSKGTGLGLYISKSIIDIHKGRIWVESEIGKGSTFSFSLPIAQTSQFSRASLPPQSGYQNLGGLAPH